MERKQEKSRYNGIEKGSHIPSQGIRLERLLEFIRLFEKKVVYVW